MGVNFQQRHSFFPFILFFLYLYSIYSLSSVFLSSNSLYLFFSFKIFFLFLHILSFPSLYSFFLSLYSFFLFFQYTLSFIIFFLSSISLILSFSSLYSFFSFRTVSKAAGEELASQYECLFTECSAAEDLESVELLFHKLLREIVRENSLPLQPLFISEDKSGLPRIPKSPHEAKKDYNSRLLPKRIPSRSPATFRIFNKSFKIFN